MMAIPSHRAKRGPPARDRRDGYILVEVLATMTISALVLVGLVSVMSLVMRTSGRTGAASQEVEDRGRIVAALTREIEGIRPIRWAGQNPGFVFQGTDHGVVFARRIALPDGTADDRVVFLQGNQKQLIRKDVPLLPGYQGFVDLPTNGQPVLLQARYTIRFAYFARLDGGQEALVPAWTRTDQLPVAIRVSLVDDRGSPITATRIAVHVDAEPGCAAPGHGVCGLYKVAATDDGNTPATSKPVDAEDSLGWLRYAQ